MGLLQKLKSALGLDGTRSPDTGTAGPRDVDVTVEREPSSDVEDAVKGTETAASGTVTGDEPGGEIADVEEPIDEDETLDEDGRAEQGDDEALGDEPVVGEGDEGQPAGDADTADVPAGGSTDPVTEINGIGPAYGQRLAAAGVETVAELAAADPDELEAATDISANRIAGWIDAAAAY